MYGSMISEYSRSSSSDKFMPNRLAMSRICESVGRFTVMFVTKCTAAGSLGTAGRGSSVG